ncbi:MAG: guanylate cyclase, partial [Alphaproteobacteria bacterium HGW-Alphaproteobacteria-5]
MALKTHINDWLAERGMSEYAELFVKQKIDLGVLVQLTEQDLRELGVALGDRRKILGWIAELDKSVAASRQAAPTDAALSAERRQVTVLFSDLVDSTGLSRRLDPEDLRAVIRAYQEAVTKIVRAYDGFVAGFRGDGVLVYFGYPQAHEDDVERAVRAALELVPAVSTIKAAEPLKTRVGIATGLVVVGDLIGSGDTSERNMVGDTPNLAARLLALAEPNSVVIADEAREMLGDFFDFEDLGLRHVKGIEHPVRSWTVMNPRAVESRFEAMHGAVLTEFSGREDELQLLLKRWSKAKTGDGQVVLISGEPGIGKSRLTAALMEEIASEPHVRLRYF